MLTIHSLYYIKFELDRLYIPEQDERIFLKEASTTWKGQQASEQPCSAMTSNVMLAPYSKTLDAEQVAI